MIRLNSAQQQQFENLLGKLRGMQPEQQLRDLANIEQGDPDLATYLRGALGMPVSLLDLSQGDVLNGYVLVELVNRGGFGQVWRAKQQVLQRSVAIKFIDPYLLITKRMGAPAMVQKFREEILTLAGFRHPHIVRLLDTGEIPLGWGGLEVPYGIMEFEESNPIHPSGYLRDRDARVRCFLEACDAVAVSHHRGLVHLDLSPNNVRVRPDGQAVVIDFGLSTSLDPTRPYPVSLVGVGTVAFMAPEQVDSNCGAIGRATDVHALGVILFQMLSPDRLPYQLQEHDDPEIRQAGLIRAILNPERVDVRVWRPDVPPTLAEIVARAIQFRPADRFADAGELHAALSAWQKTKDDKSAAENPPGGVQHVGHTFNVSGGEIGSINAPINMQRGS